MEKRYVYDVEAHPMAVSEADCREYDMNRAAELAKESLTKSTSVSKIKPEAPIWMWVPQAKK
jgi:hypothetical protein